MDFEKNFAEAIILAQKIREESFDHAMADRLKKERFPDFRTCYKLSIYEAANKAAELLGFDKRMTQPIYLLNEYNWNDAYDWAMQLTKGE